MSVAVWRLHLFSCSWPAIHDHKGFPVPGKGVDKPRGCISKLSFTMVGGAYHKTRGRCKMDTRSKKEQIHVKFNVSICKSIKLACVKERIVNFDSFWFII